MTIRAMNYLLVNRHGEILARDGEFYPPEAFPQRTAELFASQAEAVQRQQTIRDYTRIVPTEVSL